MSIIKTDEKFEELSHKILSISNRGVPRIDFLQEISKLMLDFSGCETFELLLSEDDNFIHTWISTEAKYSFQYEVIPSVLNDKGIKIPNPEHESAVTQLHVSLFNKDYDPTLPYFTQNGSFFGHGCLVKHINTNSGNLTQSENDKDCKDFNDTTLIVVPVDFGSQVIGTLQFTCKRANYLLENEVALMERVAQNLGIAIVNQRTQAALQERVKELTCLYRITQVAETEVSSLEDILRSVVDTLPPAWQYPEITTAKIVYNGQTFVSKDYRTGWQKQVADIVVNSMKKGYIEVSYTELKPYLDEGPFLREERSLIEAIARQLALIIERKEVQKERLELQEQLRHADRLAIIGQLAAGVAHELNEPLGSILGFAQLTKKTQGFPEQAEQDIDKIIKASLHAREIIRKLLVFAREIKAKIGPVNLNNLIKEGLYFLESRCQKSGIEIVHNLDPNIPDITGDESQLHQVLVNLIVNSIQAMPDGGILTINTFQSKNYVCMVIEDNGKGISEDIKPKIFVPFFTTKDVSEGTGLGLAVVHGIITSHKGRIKVDSTLGKGTKFEIRLPISQSNGKGK